MHRIPSEALSIETNRLAAGLARTLAIGLAIAVSILFFFAIVGIWEMRVAISSLILFIALALAVIRWRHSTDIEDDTTSQGSENHG